MSIEGNKNIMRKRGGNRGPKIKPSIKELIRITALGDRRGRGVVARELQGLIEKSGEFVPTEDTLIKMISEVRNEEREAEDKPWHMGFLNGYPQSPEALAGIIGAYQFAVEHSATLTNREARWIGRLSAVARQMFPALSDRELGPLLIVWGLEYAEGEMQSIESRERLFDTTELDYWVAFGDHVPQTWEVQARLSLMRRQLRRGADANVAKQRASFVKRVTGDSNGFLLILADPPWKTGQLGEEAKRALSTKVTELLRALPDCDEKILQEVRLLPKQTEAEVGMKPTASNADLPEEGQDKDEPIKKTGKKGRGKKGAKCEVT